ncbi:hypothetical protein I553_2379 [Mycobacterium xenopi 4042]|uniref:Patatin-like phospholipase family protein n=1 Tax=Mycobacterium xenopi 4042 TaxID=1299334 RepID=X8C9R1_MYCXE|nr:hypothetical protein I553_2379 [Mycobacterium xenopi 4042]
MDAGYSVQRVAGVSAGSVVGAILAAASKGSQLTARRSRSSRCLCRCASGATRGRPCRRICGGLLRQTSMYRGDFAYEWVRSELKISA